MVPLYSILAFSLRDRLAVMSWLELVLWIGLASLTVALLVLMSTRWGQVRPVSKCVALSVFAHLLFLAYAYGTNLRFNAMGLAWEPTIQVTLSQESESDPEMPEMIETESQLVDLSPMVSPPSSVGENAWSDESPPPAESVESSSPAPELLVAAPAAPSPPPPLLPDPDLFDPTEMVAEPVEIVEAPSSAVVTPEGIASSAVPTPASADAAQDAIQPVEPRTSQSAAESVASSDRSDAGFPGDLPGGSSQPIDATTSFATASHAPPRTPRRPIDDQPLPEVYRLRTSENRLQLAIPFGATEQSEAGVQAALKWLAAAQSADGRWDASDFGAGHETKTLGHDRQGAGEHADTGITGLALLAFLGAGNTHVQGDYPQTVQHGLEFLLRSQASDGNLAGPARIFEKMYCHGIALLALGEAHAMTGDPRLQAALQDAVNYSIRSQHPVAGGWRYQPGDRGDISQFGWQVMALRSAELGGMPLDFNTRSLMLKFLESATSGTHRGLASYRPGERVTRTMTAEAMCCRYFLNSSPSAAAAREASDFLLQELPGRGQSNLYYWYYATMALYQEQGPAWTTWNAALQQHLLARQRTEGRAAGSWDTDDVWGGYGGRIYTTAMGTLCLEVYYRYLPLYEQLDQTRHAAGNRPRDVRR